MEITKPNLTFIRKSLKQVSRTQIVVLLVETFLLFDELAPKRCFIMKVEQRLRDNGLEIKLFGGNV